jgi:hypothetical protein
MTTEAGVGYKRAARQAQGIGGRPSRHANDEESLEPPAFRIQSAAAAAHHIEDEAV